MGSQLRGGEGCLAVQRRQEHVAVSRQGDIGGRGVSREPDFGVDRKRHTHPE